MAKGNNRKRKPNQAAAARAVASARGTGTGSTKVILGVVAVVVIAVVVIGGVLLFQHNSTNNATNGTGVAKIPASPVSGSSRYTARLDKTDGTVLVGKPTAKVTIDVYEDFICPYCEQFESKYFTSIEQDLEAGTIKVRYHMLNFLDGNSNPAGYSSRAANTALAVAAVDPSKFVDFHYSLYQNQPEEGSAGYSQAQLTSLANRLGVSGPQFDQLVSSNAFLNAIKADTTNAENDKALWAPGQNGFGTPTIAHNGRFVDTSSSSWLSDLVKSGS